MKYILYIIRIVFPAVALSAHLSTASAEEIRIIPHSAYVRNDSLHLSLEMDLNAVRVNTLTSIYFTPILKGEQDKLELPPVIITGTKRYRFERRERTLTSRETPLAIPYLVLLDNRKTRSKNIEYVTLKGTIDSQKTGTITLANAISGGGDMTIDIEANAPTGGGGI